MCYKNIFLECQSQERVGVAQLLVAKMIVKKNIAPFGGGHHRPAEQLNLVMIQLVVESYHQSLHSILHGVYKYWLEILLQIYNFFQVKIRLKKIFSFEKA